MGIYILIKITHLLYGLVFFIKSVTKLKSIFFLINKKGFIYIIIFYNHSVNIVFDIYKIIEILILKIIPRRIFIPVPSKTEL